MQLLIHGFGTYADYGKFGSLTDPVNAGFAAWHGDIINGKAVVFNWGLSKTFTKALYFRIHSHLDFYREEVALCSDTHVLKKLNLLIQKTQPTKIVCHSTGAYLFLEYCKNYQLPDTLKQVIFLQANIPNRTPIPENLLHSLTSQSIKLFNTHCWYDQTLITAAIIDREQKAGLVGWKLPQIINKKVHLDPKNPHQSILRDKKYSNLQ